MKKITFLKILNEYKNTVKCYMLALEDMLKNKTIKKNVYNNLKFLNNQEKNKIINLINKIKFKKLKKIYKNIEYYDIITHIKKDLLLKLTSHCRMLKLYKLNDINNYYICKLEIKNILKKISIINKYIGLFKND